MASRSPFLKLPRELRNEIHGYIALNDAPYWLKKPWSLEDGKLLTFRFGMLIANHQISSEYQAVAVDVVCWPQTTIIATVLNFDFKTLREFYRSTLLKQGVGNLQNKKVHVHLIIKDMGQTSSSTERSWLRFCAYEEVPEIDYFVVIEESNHRFPKQPPRTRRLDNVPDSFHTSRIWTALEVWRDYLTHCAWRVRHGDGFMYLVWQPRRVAFMAFREDEVKGLDIRDV